MIDGIRKNAPKGATHYKKEGEYTLYYKDDVYALWLYIFRIRQWSITKYRLHDLKPLY